MTSDLFCHALWVVGLWLDEFPYRIEVGWAVVVGVVAVLGMAMLAMSRQVLRASRMNPVDSLRCE